MGIEIEKTEDQIATYTPYNRDFIARAKDLGGRWDGDAWVFDARDEQRVREALIDVYGTDGSADAETVTVRVELDNDADQEITLAGRTIARRKSKTARVKLSDGFIAIEGSFKDRGGSRKNPRIGKADHITLEGRDIPVTVARKMVEDGENYTDGVQPGGVEIVDEVDAQREAAEAQLRSSIQNAKDAGLQFEDIAAILRDEEL